MAIWVCDAGSLTYNKKFGVYRMDLHTECFTYKDNVFLCRNLSEKYGMGFRINSRIYPSGKSYYICISGKDKLRRLVSNFYEFVPKCMQYKFKYYV